MKRLQKRRGKTRSRLLFLVFIALMLGACRPVEPVRVVFLGDSVTYGEVAEGREYVVLVGEWLGPDYEVIKMGEPGGCSWDVLWLEGAIRALEPDILVIYYGSNDVKKIHTGSKSWEDFEEAMLFLASLSEQVLLITPHRGREFPERNYYLADVVVVRDIVLSLGEPVVDVYAVCCEETELADYVHPNRIGHQLIADVVYEAIQNLLAGKAEGVGE